MNDGAARRLNFRRRLADFHPRDSLDLLSQPVGGVIEQLSMKLLHLSSGGGTPSQGLSAGDSASWSVITRVPSLRTRVADLAVWLPVRRSKAIAARAICSAMVDLGLSAMVELDLFIGLALPAAISPCRGEKKTGVAEHRLGIRSRRHTHQRTPRPGRVVL
jgi:hypothetical protein